MPKLSITCANTVYRLVNDAQIEGKSVCYA